MEKQQKERTRLLKERQAIRSKMNKREHFQGIFPDQPQTFTEMCVREVFEQKFMAHPADKPYDHQPQHDDDFNPRIIKTNMLDLAAIGVAPDPDELTQLIKIKKQQLDKMIENMQKKNKLNQERIKMIADDELDLDADQVRAKIEKQLMSSDDEEEPADEKKEWN